MSNIRFKVGIGFPAFALAAALGLLGYERWRNSMWEMLKSVPPWSARRGFARVDKISSQLKTLHSEKI